MENRQEENEELEQISEENVNTVSSSTLSGGTETGGFLIYLKFFKLFLGKLGVACSFISYNISTKD